MPSGVIRLRHSRKNHATGKMKVELVDTSGLRGTGTRNGSVLRTTDTPSDPGNKFRPFGSTTGKFPSFTEPPKAQEDVDNGREGPPRSSNNRRKH